MGFRVFIQKRDECEIECRGYLFQHEFTVKSVICECWDLAKSQLHSQIKTVVMGPERVSYRRCSYIDGTALVHLQRRHVIGSTYLA